ncbi:inositol monophosphatase family protein [Fructobacillus ficulneus]|uniref:Myo-inositol-1(Or 4)-monophosphatase n=1 Tax=Fructobacillus ficulneus TaxID=157463 RepID=A0A0K8MIE9_9LACO|nr:inositol monophosphatase family protein [Fructobacillus ficulneus]GAP00228.1 Myo-inositol-1(or 4)-monophosphatase [Fructobacillus ficulneus]
MNNLSERQLKTIDNQVTGWLAELGQQVRQGLGANRSVQTKEGDFRNLVTDLDKSNQAWLLDHLRNLDSQAHFVAEEGDLKRPETMVGHVWFVDPIDGTLNFVHEKTDFAIMVALYVDGQPTLAWIAKVMSEEIYHGGPDLGVFCNEQKLPAVVDRSLDQAIVILSGRRLLSGEKPYRLLAEKALAFRVIGSAGISFVRLLQQQATGYLSKLSPWDLAAGRVLSESLGYQVKRLDGEPVNMLLSNTVLIATNKMHLETIKVIKD